MKRIYGISLAVIAWFFIIFQLNLSTGTVSNFFSFFTIQCNLLIAISLTFSQILPDTSLGKFFSKTSVQSAIALYIFIVGLVYNTALRGLVPLIGWSVLVDNMLHVVIPLLYILYWFLYRTRGKLTWKDGLYWTLFPFAYLFYTLIRGAMVDWYPYPFLNVLNHGYGQVFVNIGIVISIFLLAGFGVIFLVRRESKL
jgi:hypothetical protein